MQPGSVSRKMRTWAPRMLNGPDRGGSQGGSGGDGLDYPLPFPAGRIGYGLPYVSQ